MRKYEKNIDDYYSPDSTPDLYLDEDLVILVLDSIDKIETDDEIEVREVIKKIESIQRDYCINKITLEESKSKIRYISEQFFNKYEYWPYVTKTYDAFYRYFDKQE